MPLDPNAAQMIQFLTATFPDIGRDVVDPVEARRLLANFGFPRGPEVAQIDYRRIPGLPGDPTIPIRIYWPRTEEFPPYPVVVYFHPGGFTLCDLDTHDGICRLIANDASVIVVSVDYRLAPEYKYPAAVNDAYAAVCWTAEQASTLGGDPSRLSVVGDSSGGTLAAVSCLRARDLDGPPIAHQLLIYPSTDLPAADHPSRREYANGYFLTTTHLAWYIEQYLADAGQAAEPYASPMRARDLSGLPPALVVTAEFCPLRDEGEAYAARMTDSGVRVKSQRAYGLCHGFFGMGGSVPAARAAEKRVTAELREALRPRVPGR